MRIFVKLAALATLFASAAVAVPVPKDKTQMVAEVLSAAEKAASEIKNSQERADTLLEIAHEYAQAGDTKTARRVFGEVVDLRRTDKKKSITYLPAEMVAAGLIDDGLELLEKLAADYPKDLRDTRFDCLFALKGSGKVKQQTELFNAIPLDEKEVVASLMAGEYAAAGDFKSAEGMLDGLTNPDVRAEVRLELAVAYHRAKDAKKSAEHLKVAAETIRNEIDGDTDYWQSKMAIAQVRTGDRETAITTIGKITNSTFRTQAILAVMKADLAAGNVKAATDAAKLCEKEDIDQAMFRVAVFHLNKGETEKAAKVLKGFNSRYWQARGRLWMAVTLAKGRKADETKKEIAEANELVLGEDFWKLEKMAWNLEEKDTLRLDFARAWVAVGEARERMSEYAKLSDPCERCRRLLTLAKGFRPPVLDGQSWWDGP